MGQFGRIILAIVLAVATVAVPVKLAAHAGRSAATAAADWRVVAEAASEARSGAGSSKRCQSGAGMLGCPFYRPAAVVALSTAIDAPIRFEADVPALTGRVVPIASGPPKSLSV